MVVKSAWIVKRNVIRTQHGNCFGIHCNSYLDPKGNRGHLQPKSNAPMKFESLAPIGCWVIGWRLFWHTVWMWPWPLSPRPQNQIGIIYCPRPLLLERWEPRTCVVELLVGNSFNLQGQCDLELWSCDPKRKSHLLAKTNAPLKFWDRRHFGCRVNFQKLFWHTRSMQPWSLSHWPQSQKGSCSGQNQCSYGG
jgi:hypothetical protein